MKQNENIIKSQRRKSHVILYELFGFSRVQYAKICLSPNNEAQICTKIKNKLTTIEARLQMQMKLLIYIEKHNTSRRYLWRYVAGLSASSRKEDQIVPHVFYDSAEVYILVLAVIINMQDGNKNNLRTT